MNCITDEPFISRKTSHITKSIDTFLDLYEARGFNITAVHRDNKFNTKTLKAKLIPIFTQIYIKEDHDVIIVNMIRVINESERCMCHATTYQYYTNLMFQSLTSFVLNWINKFPTKGGISKTMSSFMAVEEKPNLDFNREMIVLE